MGPPRIDGGLALGALLLVLSGSTSSNGFQLSSSAIQEPKPSRTGGTRRAPSMQLQGRVALVTGASRGIGRGEQSIELCVVAWHLSQLLNKRTRSLLPRPIILPIRSRDRLRARRCWRDGVRHGAIDGGGRLHGARAGRDAGGAGERGWGAQHGYARRRSIDRD